MYTTIQEFFDDTSHIVTVFDAFVRKHGLSGNARPDHICYKCDSPESYEAVRALFEEESSYIYQSIISQRRISYIRFKTPIETLLGPVWYLELSDQKPDGSQKDGFDHIEVYPTVGSYDDMVERLSLTEDVVHIERPHHTTDDITLPSGFLFRCTTGPLIEKIKKEEMI